MGRMVCLWVLCSVLISCNTDVYFFTLGEAESDPLPEEDLLYYSEQGSERKEIFSREIKFESRTGKNRQSLAGDLSPVKVPKPQFPPKYVYTRPDAQTPLEFKAPSEFMQLAQNNLPSRERVPPSSLVWDFKEDEGPTGYIGASDQKKPDPALTPLESFSESQSVLFSVETSEGGNYPEKQNVEREGPPALRKQEWEAPPSPELALEPAVNRPDQVFIPRPLDILFVVDTSESMHKNLINFRKKFSGFLNYLAPLDWRIAITNADHGETGFFLFNWGALKGKAMKLERDGRVLDLKYLHPLVPDYHRVFLDSLSRHPLGKYKKSGGENGPENVGYCELPPGCQSLQEQPIKSLMSALGKNRRFFRKSADFIAIVISNSKERGEDQDLATQPLEVIKTFQTLHGSEKRFKVYGIIITENDEKCLKQNITQQFLFPEGDFSEKIHHLSQITGGEVFSICSPNYKALGQSIFNSFVKGWR